MIRFWSLMIQETIGVQSHFTGRLFSGKTNRFNISDVHWHGPMINQPGWNDPQARCCPLPLVTWQKTPIN